MTSFAEMLRAIFASFGFICISQENAASPISWSLSISFWMAEMWPSDLWKFIGERTSAPASIFARFSL